MSLPRRDSAKPLANIGKRFDMIARTLLAAWLALALPCAAVASSDAEPPAPAGAGVDVERYVLQLRPDLDSGRLSARQRIVARVLEDGLRAVEFDAGDLEVRSVSHGGESLEFVRQQRRLRILLSSPVRAGERLELDLSYIGEPKHGLQFHPARREMYTIFSTSQWMVCVDAPAERAALDLELILPRDLRVAASGRPSRVREVEGEDGLRAHRWLQAEAVPSFVYGFAAAPYREVEERASGVRLRYLSIDQDEMRLSRTFADTRDMLRFFERRAGFSYRGDYAQVLVASTVGQEMAGLAVVSEAYGAKVLDDPQNRALLAHELAHQWWGVSVTCRDWGHFWLNEGFANFMAAAWLEHRFGAQAYRDQVEGWERRIERLRNEGADRSVVYARWFRPSANDRAVVYQKGAYVLHRLRLHLGERDFWRGIRAYTRAHRGRSVVTADFRRAMEQTSGRDLGDFFAEWVDGPAAVDAQVPEISPQG